ncbi:hypothetical protein BH11ACT4_BH11ACT4_12370 [soil metagenome]
MAAGRRWRGAVAVGLLIGLAGTGCAARPAAASLPDGVTVSVFQNRFDYGARALELEIRNGTADPITVTAASFESTRFASPADWDRPQVVPDGSARDLKVQLPAPRCDGTAPVDTVVIAFTLADGRSGRATLTPTDEQGRVDAINAEDCLGVSVAAIAAITPPDAIRWTPGAHAPAAVDLAVVPTGAAGSFTIRYAKGTVLLSLVDEASGQPYDMALDRRVDAQAGASVIPLRVVPARCDAHAVEEDKRGTFFPLEVETDDGRSGKLYVAVSDEVRRGLYDFYADYCGLP